MRKIRLTLAIAVLLSLAFVSNKSKSDHYTSNSSTASSKCKVVVVMDENVKVIHDIVLYSSSRDVEKMVSRYPKGSRFYEGLAVNLKPGKEIIALSVEIYVDGQFIPGDMFISGDQFLPGEIWWTPKDIARGFTNDYAISGDVVEKLTGERSKGMPVDVIGKMEVKRSERKVNLTMGDIRPIR